MRKIWTVYDNWNMVELGAFWHEDQALARKTEYLDYLDLSEEGIDDSDILIEAFTVQE